MYDIMIDLLRFIFLEIRSSALRLSLLFHFILLLLPEMLLDGSRPLAITQRVILVHVAAASHKKQIKSK